MLRVDQLEFSIGEKRILKGVCAEFEAGKIHGIIGPNGSGKSTLLKNICRIWEPQKGNVFIQGEDYRSITRKDLSRLVSDQIRVSGLGPLRAGFKHLLQQGDRRWVAELAQGDDTSSHQ